MLSVPSSRLPAAFGLLVGIAILLAACGQTTGSPDHTGSHPPSGEPSAIASDLLTSGPSGSAAVGQTDTEWGRIWDAIPADFPIIPGAEPAPETGIGPASAVLAVQTIEAAGVAEWFQDQLEIEQFSTEALSGPLEDGSYVLDSVGEDECRIQTTVTPQGAFTTIVILYGAACPSS
jgi:hypothetical protein